MIDHRDGVITYPILWLIAFAIFVSTVFFFVYNANTLHFIPAYLNDQIGFIGAARHLVDFGHLLDPGHYEGTGSSIIPALLRSTHTRLYMPGMYLLLAASYKLFGVSAFSSILPDLAAYILSAVALYYIGRRLYSREVGLWSAVLFLLMPLNIFHAYNVVLEMPLVLVALSVFLAFITLPARWRVWSIPALLSVTILFRESLILMLIPMVAYQYDDNSDTRWWQVALVTLMTFVMLKVITFWQVSQGAYGINYIQALKFGHIDYYDAFTNDNSVMSLGQFFIVFINHALAQTRQLVNEFLHVKLNDSLLHTMTMLEIIFFTVVTFVVGIRQRKQAWFPVSCALCLLAMLGACLALHNGMIHCVLRILLFTVPFVIVQTARYFLDPACQTRGTGKSYLQQHRAYLFSAYVVIAVITSIFAANYLRHFETQSAQYTSFIESVHPDKTRVLVAPVSMFIEYNYKHYPALTSMIPHNKQTLVLLNSRYPIGTIIIAEDQLNTVLARKDINEIGLSLFEQKSFQGQRYFIFKRQLDNRSNA